MQYLCESGSVNSKGMVVINEIQSGESEVLLHLFDNESLSVGIDSTIFFHKKVHGAVNLSDFKASAPRIRQQ